MSALHDAVDLLAPFLGRKVLPQYVDIKDVHHEYTINVAAIQSLTVKLTGWSRFKDLYYNYHKKGYCESDGDDDSDTDDEDTMEEGISEVSSKRRFALLKVTMDMGDSVLWFGAPSNCCCGTCKDTDLVNPLHEPVSNECTWNKRVTALYENIKGKLRS